MSLLKKNKLDKPINPEWFDNLSDKYRADIAHTFILNFNVSDYMDNTSNLKQFIIKKFKEREIIIFYNRASGINFASPRMREKALKLIGTNSNNNDPIMQALQQSKVDNSFIPDTDVIDAFNSIEKILKSKDIDGGALEPVVVINYTETLAPSSPFGIMSKEDRYVLVKLQEWAKDREIGRNYGLIILVTNNAYSIHPDLRSASSKIEAIEIPLPNLESRINFIEYSKNKSTEEDPFNIDENFDIRQFAVMTSGLSKMSIEDICLRSKLTNEPICPSMVMERKKDIISQEYGEIIEMPPLYYDYSDIGGHEKIKKYFRRHVIKKLQDGNPKGCPMGILMLGPPGTGKSLFARATAKEANVNFVQLNPGKLKGGIVGQSEAMMEKAIRAIISNVPTLVFIDEIDQAINMSRTYSGDGNVSSNQFRRLMEVMSDTSLRGQVIWLTATNRPDLLDSAFKREGRIDKRIPFLLPENDKERVDIMLSIIKRYGFKTKISEYDLLELAMEVEKLTQAQLEALLQKAYEISEDSEREIIEKDDIKKAIKYLKPSTGDIELMTMLALKETNDLSLLPEKYLNIKDDEETLSDKIKQLENKYGEIK